MPLWGGPPRERTGFSKTLPTALLHLQLPAVCPLSSLWHTFLPVSEQILLEQTPAH